MKKLFHRRKNSAPSSPEQTPPRIRNSEITNTDPSIRTSRYESTAPADRPQTGQYPLKGNNSAAALQGRRSDTFSRGQPTGGVEANPRASTSTPYYGSLPTPRVTSASYDRPHESAASRDYQQRQTPQLPVQDFSSLNLNSTEPQNDDEDFPIRQHHGGSTFAASSPSPGYSASNEERRVHVDEGVSGIRMVGRAEPSQPNRDFARQTRDTAPRDQGGYGYHDDGYSHIGTDSSSHVLGNRQLNEAPIARNRANPPKESARAGQFSAAATQSAPTSSLRMGTSRNHILPQSTPGSHSDDQYGISQDTARPMSNAPANPQRANRDIQLSAQQVVDRARQDTYDTDVVEKVAPAVVHETVHKEIHHVREERITREIHTHDVYHRILPVTDVEVLPPRHFLPVEGGGLVEISGKEVPGRAKNWVIAETASKIPSDQPASTKPRIFSARQFPGTEGDAISYITPEGYEKTEQTWVHPPELETGGRDTGQTWPMEFGSETTTKAGREHKSSKPSKTRHSRKPVESQLPTTEQPRMRIE